MIVSCVWVVGMGGVFGFNWISYDEFELVGGGWTDVVMYSFVNFFVGVSGSTRIHVELGRYSFWIYTVLYNCHLVHTSWSATLSLFVRPPRCSAPPTVAYSGAGGRRRHECLGARPAPSAGNQLAVRAFLGHRWKSEA